MAETGYETRNKVACVKCKQRHKPPVGISCKRVKAVRSKQQTHKDTRSSLTTDSLGVVMDGSQPGTSSQGTSEPQGESDIQITQKPAKKAKKPTTADVLDKLNVVMEKFGDFEKRLEQQERRGSSSVSVLSQPSSHSSPKHRSGNLSTLDRSGQQQGRKPLPSVDFLK